MKLSDLWDPVLDFIYPPVCLLCDEKYSGSDILCPACSEFLERSAQLDFINESADFYHLSDALYFDGIYYFWEFTPEIQKLVHHLKYNGMTKIADFLGKIMATQFIHKEEVDCIVPIPLHPVRYRERGYNQSEKVAFVLSKFWCVSMQSNILKRISYTPTQTHLTAEERQKNLSNSFNASCEKVKGQSILLVDDIITTGSTMNICAKVLKNAGAKQVFGCSIARPQLRLQKELS